MSAREAEFDWAIVTGEYPPHPGGVSDYCAVIAAELARRGERVLVVAPAPAAASSENAPSAATIEWCEGGFLPRQLGRLSRRLRGRVRRWLVQYVPHGFGMRALNAPFVAWLLARREPVWTMFHEVALPLERGAPLRRNAVAVAHRAMAVPLARRSERVLVSTCAWREIPFLFGALGRAEWMPIPSNLPVSPAASRIAAWKARREREGARAIAHFGTFGSAITQPLARVIDALRDHADVRVVLIGRGSTEFAATLGTPSDRVEALGALGAEDAAAAIAACDLALQVYPDGITTRRTSAIASLALGVPLATNIGVLTEPVWRTTPGILRIDSSTPADAAATITRALRDPEARAAVGHAGAELYRRSFAVERAVDRLLGPPDPSWTVTP